MMNVIMYRKTGCPWANEVSAFLKERGIRCDERDVTMNPDFKREVEEKTGQSKSPTLDIDGEILADVGVEEVAAHFEKLGVKA